MIDIRLGDCRERMAEMPAGSVRCCVTSPPYWGLRDYGTARWVGGDPGCDHRQGRPGAGRADGIVDDRAQRNRDGVGSMGGDCRRCGAQRIDSQLGLERTPDEYVAGMVEVFRAVRRVLADDGTLWLNLGDSYATAPGRVVGGGPPSPSSSLRGNGHIGGGPKLHQRRTHGERALERKGLDSDTQSCSDLSADRDSGALATRSGVARLVLKPKDLVGIPWRVAFALQADGWWLRSDIIWHKPNPMPESVTDRPTSAHEHVFLFSKSERYHYDADAIREDRTGDEDANGFRAGSYTGGKIDNGAVGKRTAVGNKRVRGLPPRHAQYETSDQSGLDDVPRGAKRNARNVWTIATRPFPEAHFATFPPELAERCILAGCPIGGTVLDPFGGAGTTGLAADRLGRSAILIEINSKYAVMASARIVSDSGLFSHVINHGCALQAEEAE